MEDRDSPDSFDEDDLTGLQVLEGVCGEWRVQRYEPTTRKHHHSLLKATAPESSPAQTSRGSTWSET